MASGTVMDDLRVSQPSDWPSWPVKIIGRRAAPHLRHHGAITGSGDRASLAAPDLTSGVRRRRKSLIGTVRAFRTPDRSTAWGAKRGANSHSRQATPGHYQPLSVQLKDLPSHTRRHSATPRRWLLSSGSRVRVLPRALPPSVAVTALTEPGSPAAGLVRGGPEPAAVTRSRAPVKRRETK